LEIVIGITQAAVTVTVRSPW